MTPGKAAKKKSADFTLKDAEQLALLERPSDVRTDFVDVTGHIYIVRPAASGLSALDQARTLLRGQLRRMDRFSW